MTPDQQLAAIITQEGLTGRPAEGHPVITPAQSSKVKLGEMLFFSKALSLDYQTACASCHHPKLGSGDDLSLPIGVAALDQAVLGPERRVGVDPGPLADGGPDVPRNSQPIFNAALYQTAMFWDGRVFVGGVDAGGVLQIKTPDSVKRADPDAGGNLLQAQSRFPITSPDEMRGYHHPELVTSYDVRDFIVARLRGEANTVLNYDPAADPNMTAADRTKWQDMFTDAYGAGTTSSLITFAHIQEAIAAYEAGQIFVNSPWNAYVQGDSTAISDAAKQGALLFYKPIGEGGLGCAACHQGDRFTDEKFYNVGFPQFGHGKRTDRKDLGRFSVVQAPENMFAFRTPSLLNVMDTAPWGHDGAFGDMSTLLRYHVNPFYYQPSYNIHDLHQFPDAFVGDMLTNYQLSLTSYTSEVLAASSFAGDKLAQTQLTDTQLADLEAFLGTLSDPVLNAYRQSDDCHGLTPCPGEWVPSAQDTLADNNTLVPVFVGSTTGGDAGSGSGNGDTSGSNGVVYPASVTLNYPINPVLSGFADMTGCVLDTTVANSGTLAFDDKASALGLANAVNGYDDATWGLQGAVWAVSIMEYGSLSTAYLNDDCWPDLLFSGGDKSGLKTYINKGNGSGFVDTPMIDASVYADTGIDAQRFADVLPVDLNGDYRHELVLGNALPGNTTVLAWNAALGKYQLAGKLPMGRNTFSISAGDINQDGYPDLYLAHWGPGGLPGSAPALFANTAGTALQPVDGAWGVGTADGMTQTFNFSPAFADINGDGKQDLLVASDFLTSWMSHNTGSKFINDDPLHQTLVDTNGMGQTLLDFDNDGLLDWFVSSIFDPAKSTRPSYADWGVTGNQLYRNITAQGGDYALRFDNVTQAGITDSSWAWGNCAADFNNDGWQDLFVENGYGYIPSPEDPNSVAGQFLQLISSWISPITQGLYSTKPHLFINNGNGTFTDVSEQMNFKASNGRGVVCVDFDHDGDMDIGVNNNSGALLFYVNQQGRGAGHHFLDIRLQGKTPNTDALGAVVKVTADLNGDGIIQAQETQTRAVNANSHYLSHNTTDLHFGLGKAVQADIDITWPAPQLGHVSFDNVAANQFVTYRQ